MGQTRRIFAITILLLFALTGPIVVTATSAASMTTESTPSVTPSVTPSSAIWQPSSGSSWQIQFGEPLAGAPLDVAVYDLDGFETDAATISELHAKGIHVLCYVSMGTLEDWRPDAKNYPPSVIGKEWADWKGERFLDIRQLELLAPAIDARLDMCAQKGFDAVEPDNIDTFQNGEKVTGFDLTEDDQIRFNLWLADQAHARGLAIGQKNIPDLTAALEPSYDFAVTEDCFVDGWCDELLPYLQHGKPVFAIEYTDRDADLSTICPIASGTHYSVVLKHRDLDAWGQTCP